MMLSASCVEEDTIRHSNNSFIMLNSNSSTEDGKYKRESLFFLFLSSISILSLFILRTSHSFTEMLFMKE